MTGYCTRRISVLLPVLLLVLLVSACAHRPLGKVTETIYPARLSRTFEMGLDIADRYHVSAIRSRRFTHEELWAALETPVGAPVFRVEEVGRSIGGRPILTVTFGHGPTVVLLWSQMHGDESTATMALADIINYFADPSPDPFREDLLGRLTVVMIPMLNPDGAQLFQRRNAIGIDINREARRLATPEARILKEVRGRVQPQFGFNLHDQNPHTYAGGGGRRTVIALLAPPADEERSWGPVRARARLVAATIAEVLQTELPGRIARYRDAFNARAFGDLMQKWDTSTVLIESGVLDDDPEKQRLRALNVAALLTALRPSLPCGEGLNPIVKWCVWSESHPFIKESESEIESISIGRSDIQILPMGVGTMAWGLSRLWGYGDSLGLEDVESGGSTLPSFILSFDFEVKGKKKFCSIPPYSCSLPTSTLGWRPRVCMP